MDIEATTNREEKYKDILNNILTVIYGTDTTRFAELAVALGVLRNENCTTEFEMDALFPHIKEIMHKNPLKFQRAVYCCFTDAKQGQFLLLKSQVVLLDSIGK